MKTLSRGTLLVAVLAAAPAFAVSPPPPIAIGGRAPRLTIERWLRGEPVTRFERGTVYVIDFWAVWCAPCLSGMAHVSDLADRFRDRGVRVIGLTGPDNAGNTLEGVERTLSRRGSSMRFDIAWDQPVRPGSTPYPEVLLGLTTLTYFKATQLEGLPAAVIVDREGRLAWLGLPSALEAPLSAIVEGRWDLKAAAQRDQARRRAEPRLDDLRTLLAAGWRDEARALARSLVGGPFRDEPGYLRLIASLVVDERTGNATAPDLDLALDAVERAAVLTDWTDDTVLAALARVHFVRGDPAAAVAAQEAALALMDPPLPKQVSVLQTYRQALAAPADPK